jgi:transcriptional regulator with XRE-family HTH domain
LTQFQLAERIGAAQSTVARWEAGEHAITMPTLSRIADGLGVELLVRFGKRRAIAWPES